MPTYADAARCRSCDTLSYPTRFYCPRCGGRRFTPERLEGEGTLLSWTRLHALPPDFDERHIVLVIVELDQGVRVTGRLFCEAPQLGQRLRVEIAPVREIDGERVEGLCFVDAEG